MIRRWQNRQRAQLREALNAPSSSRWENLGLWSSADQPYGEAARALALRVGMTAGLQPGDSVLDVGPGQAPDQQQLWREEFAIDRYYGWERDVPAPPSSAWHQAVAVDSAYFVPHLMQRWQSLWPHIVQGGAITWTDLYLKRSPATWRTRLQLRLTSALATIPWTHWDTKDRTLHRLQQFPHGSAYFEDLTDQVLGGFVRHMQWRTQCGQSRSGLRIAYSTAALLKPLLHKGVIGYGLFQVRRR